MLSLTWPSKFRQSLLRRRLLATPFLMYFCPASRFVSNVPETSVLPAPSSQLPGSAKVFEHFPWMHSIRLALRWLASFFSIFLSPRDSRIASCEPRRHGGTHNINSAMRISKIAAFDVSLALYKEPNRGLGHSVVRWANVYVKRAANKVLALTMSAAMSTDGHGPWGPTIWVGIQFFFRRCCLITFMNCWRDNGLTEIQLPGICNSFSS